jgi:tRNA pseudouridine55 synthase
MRREGRTPSDGVLRVDKPAGPTSHDVVDAARRALGLRRIGHLGTLDPFATGLLVLLVGRATRLATFAADWTKTYEGVIRLGTVTATDDVTGAVTGQSDAWQGLSTEAIVAALGGLVGRHEQLPPPFSAKKVAGERAYRRARRGETVTLTPVPVEVHDCVALDVSPPEVRFRATVSAGTYVRALARDVGAVLGCGAHLTSLRRLAVGQYRVDSAASVAEVEAGRVTLESMDGLVSTQPRMELDAVQYRAVKHGRPLPAGAEAADSGSVALFAEHRLVAVAERDGDLLKPRVVLEG